MSALTRSEQRRALVLLNKLAWEVRAELQAAGWDEVDQSKERLLLRAERFLAHVTAAERAKRGGGR